MRQTSNTAKFITKYNVPGPRYTSYPTVPYWKKEQWTSEDWLTTVKQNRLHFNTNTLSLYIHLPYCDSLCTFCGCHKHITTNHAVEAPYITAVLEEWRIFLASSHESFELEEIHLGGGTPTFFSPSELKRLIVGITETVTLSPNAQLGFEAHPGSTSDEHLAVLRDLGFTRVSFGIQDYDPTVQKAIHREQSFESVAIVHQKARDLGYTSISHDLVFGLPKQQLEGFIETVNKTISLLPDRISLYSYAHVPWIKGNGQRGFNDDDLPTATTKRALYETAKQLFLEAGYIEIGMDHFALPTDDLAIATHQKALHRNFMGYTTQQSPLLIGLGMSAISDSWFGFAQNEKKISDYFQRIAKGELPITRGHLLTEADLEIRTHILNLMCRFETTVSAESTIDFDQLSGLLKPMIEDGLVIINDRTVAVTESGIPFVRNCCMAFDAHLNEQQPTKPTFSQTV
ncbi:MAG: oxygen-independent coproporphyrinogen III oxidase [Flavobacteriia bacterium]|nr:oxygen-independent coproporphyrinogen III oxidase [Flavobacteriia bacterium]